MNVDKEIKELKEEEHRQQNYPLCCCWPSSSSGLNFWGLFLVVVGSIWLLSNIGFAAVIVWPLFFIGLGLFYLSRARGEGYL
jgi:uncharacterized membrane protein